jgi:amino acid transporter
MSGQLAPLCLLLVGFVLYLFKSVYGEAGTAIPLNGGAYNLLLNTTSKSVASLAACLTILSYVATAVMRPLRPSSPILLSQAFYLPTRHHARTNPFQVN